MTAIEGELVTSGAAAPLEIQIRSDFVPTFDDLVTLESMGEKSDDGRPAFKWREVREMLNRAIVGGAGHLPADAVTMIAVGAALKGYFEARANPNA